MHDITKSVINFLEFGQDKKHLRIFQRENPCSYINMKVETTSLSVLILLKEK